MRCRRIRAFKHSMARTCCGSPGTSTHGMRARTACSRSSASSVRGSDVSNEIRLLASHWQELRAHVLFDGREHAAVLLCGSVVRDGRAVLLTREVVPLTDGDILDRSSLHLSIDPVSLARLAKKARK